MYWMIYTTEFRLPVAYLTTRFYEKRIILQFTLRDSAFVWGYFIFTLMSVKWLVSDFLNTFCVVLVYFIYLVSERLTFFVIKVLYEE